MTTYYYTDDTRLAGGYAATVGFFDGVHRGHRFLIGELKRQAAEQGLQSMVITFERHPLQVLKPEWQPQFLSTFDEKLSLLAETGIDAVVVLRFTAEMAALSARDFMQLIHERLGVRLLLTGYDNRFGNGRRECFADYARYGSELGVKTVCATALVEGEHRYSSSLARQLIGEGRVEAAAQVLGRLYTLSGTVVHGHEIGRTLGFPTANLKPLDPCRLIPASGVYAVAVRLSQEAGEHYGMMNIGCRPTFDGDRQTLEVNIFDFEGDLYGQACVISFIGRLREERHFKQPEALTAQMKADGQAARDMIDKYINRT